MSFLPVFLWSDLLIWLLVLAGIVLGALSSRNPPMRAAWRRVGRSRTGMAAATVLVAFVSIGLLDSLHYRARLEGAGAGEPAAHAVEVLSVLDYLTTSVRTRLEKTYSEPLAMRSYAKEFVEVREADGSVHPIRDFPRLKFGGAHLGEDETQRIGDIVKRVLAAEALAVLILATLSFGPARILARNGVCSVSEAWRAIWRGESDFAWNAVLITLGVLLLVAAPLAALCVDYHVFGTDKVGQDVFYQILKSIRTALVIGLVTTLVTLPLAIGLGILAGYFRGWVDDVIQYLYTTL
ncbi:MAG: ABC transporter permease, partial [Propionivibrio sp.]|nr:ABC transporter permease [Propionivibrio sp.]